MIDPSLISDAHVVDDAPAPPRPRPRRVREEHVPEEVRKWIMDHLYEKVVRVSGDVTCTCGRLYHDHAEVHPTFHLLCDGRIGKT